MKQFIALLLLLGVTITSCKQFQQHQETPIMKTIPTSAVNETIENLKNQYGVDNLFRIEKGVNQVAKLWKPSDGSSGEFHQFCVDNFVGDSGKLDTLFDKLSNYFEVIYGNFNKINVELKMPMHLDGDPLTTVDELFGSYDVSAHLTDDLFANKTAFVVLLNFPSYTLEEKQAQGAAWSRKQWAHARMGDMFDSRVPADIQQKVAETTTVADLYISEYNILMDKLVDDNMQTDFPEGMKLISHWGLRDELKSNYADQVNGLEKQRIIYQVMKRIVNQEIPQNVINNHNYQWNPVTNVVYENGKVVLSSPEPNTRYAHLLNNFKALKAVDPYSPQQPTYIDRAFNGGMEITKDDVAGLFTKFISSPQVKEVAGLIEARLGRKLEPFDIWYDGFKARSNVSEESLSQITRKRYPTAAAFEKDMPSLLMKLGFTKDKAQEISSKIAVDAARGSGHAWGAAMKSEKARLRTRVTKDGMDYKGYNIAVHEFGHNVEQTISLQDVDYYMLNGVPNTAFTEALAFIFQKRDLDLLGQPQGNSEKEYLATLDNFWACYEIMGVALLDISVWEWMYANPHANKEQLKEAVVQLAKDIWNKYYAPVLGEQDSPILGIYSHMIDNPLYLSNYPMGHIIDFQIEMYLKDKPFAAEVERIYSLGRLTPQVWMKEAVGSEISIDPILTQTTEALKVIK